MLTFTNPRRDADVSDWPMGGSRRGTMYFKFEYNEKRAESDGRYKPSRQSNCNGRDSKPKLGIYGGRGCIVDGSDGRTYILQHAAHYKAIKILNAGDLKDPGSLQLGFNSFVMQEQSREMFNELSLLIDQANVGYDNS